MERVHPVCILRFRSFRTQPLEIISADSDFVCYNLSKIGAWATQPLDKILVAEILLCELGVSAINMLNTKRCLSNAYNMLNTIHHGPFKCYTMFILIQSITRPSLRMLLLNIA